MRTLIRTSLLAAILGVTLAPLATGCATSSSNSVPSTTPIDLDNTKWKLTTFVGKMDGRVVQFQKGGGGGYIGKMVSGGVALRDRAGIEGLTAFTLNPTGTLNEYRGFFTTVGSEGGAQQQEVIVTVLNEDVLRWNLDSSWSRVRD